jgi:hypothetical protein
MRTTLAEIFTDAVLIGYYEYKRDPVRADNNKACPILNILSCCVLLLSRDDVHMIPKVLGPVI